MTPDPQTVVQELVRRIADLVGADPSSLAPDTPFLLLGLSSLQTIQLSADLQVWLGRPLSPTLAFDYPTIEQAAQYIATIGGPDQAGAAACPAAAGGQGEPGEHAGQDVAIVGIGCRFPGASSPAAYWQALCTGLDAVTDVPPDRWDAARLYDPDPATADRMNTRWGGFLPDVRAFAASFFGISAREAARMDPQQRIALEVAWESLVDAGIAPSSLSGSLTGVYFGVSTFDHGVEVLASRAGAEPYDGTGSVLSVVANRLSYQLNAHGPSLVVDTACSSSLVAVHLAVAAIRSGSADLALAGGVNVITSPRIALSFSKGGLMAADGRCKPFDHRADGYVRSEGAGVIVLKPLQQARTDGDRVYAVIRGGAVNQDGRTNGLTAPSRPAQEAMLRAAYRNAATDPATVAYVEAHGTGTAVGDPIEVGALGVLTEGRPHERALLIGSVKSNLGHLEAAAGMAGLIKVTLALHHRQLPPTIHFEQANPLLGLDRLPITVVDRLQPWPEDGDRPLTAGVSSFGFGGTNAHLVLAEPAPDLVPDPAPLPTAGPAVLIPVSGRSATGLIRQVERWAELARSRAEEPQWLARAAAAAARRADHDRHRAAVVAADPAELAERLSALARGEHGPGICGPGVARRPAPRTVLVFPGQGSQWVGMGRELASQVPVFQAAMRRCNAAIVRAGGPVVWSEDGLSVEGTATVQPALFAIQVALAVTLRTWGVHPDAVVGHSLGEIAAAHVAGALSLDDAALVACERSRLLSEIAGTGGLALVELEADQAQELIEARAGELSIAAINGPRATVLSGSPGALDDVLHQLAARRVFGRRIAVDFAAHSPQVEPLQSRLAAALQGLSPRESTVALYSTVTAGPIEGADLGPGYWRTNLRAPVLFAPTIERLAEDGHTTFVEIAPHPVLARSLTDILAGRESKTTVLTTLRRSEGELQALTRTLGDLYVAGALPWTGLYPEAVPHAELPAPHWEHEHFPPPSPPVPDTDGTQEGWLQAPIRIGIEPGLRVWPLHLDSGHAPELSDHRVDGQPLIPATYWVRALATAATAALPSGPVVLGEVSFIRPLPADPDAEVQVSLRQGHVAISAQRAGQEPTVHARASVLAPSAEPEQILLADWAARCRPPIPVGPLYDRLEAAGLAYGQRFRGITTVQLGEEHALARIQRPETLPATGPGFLHPALADAALHALAALVPGHSLPLPAGAQRIWLRPGTADLYQGWAAVRLLGFDDRSIQADVTIVDDAGAVLWQAIGLRVHRVAARRPPGRGQLYPLRHVPFTPAPRPTPVARWLVLPDHGGLAQEVAQRLRARGATVEFGTGTPAELASCSGQSAAVLDTRALDAGDGDFDGVAGPAAQLVAGLASATWAGPPPRLWLLSRPTPAGGTLAGLARTTANEHPQIGCTAVELPDAGERTDLERLLALLDSDPATAHLRCAVNRITRPVLARSPVGAPPRRALRPDRTYLLTGGLGALGLQVAGRLVERGARHLLLLGRSGPSADATTAIQALRQQGAVVRTRAVDVTDPDALHAALKQETAGGEPLGGIFHLAGVLEDALLADLTPAALHRALGAKAHGAWNLHRLSLQHPVELFVLFSSLAGVIGSPGQGAYAAANSAVDALAEYRAERGLPAVSIAWGTWSRSGLAVLNGGLERMAARGVLALEPDTGLDLLEEAMSATEPVLAAAALDPAGLRLGMGPAARQMLDALLTPQAGDDAGSTAEAPQKVRDVLGEATSVGQQRRLLRQFLTGHVAGVLRTPAETVDPARPFQELGFDSLMAIELRDRLEQGLQLRLSTTIVYAHPSIQELADGLLTRLDLAPPDDAGPATDQRLEQDDEPGEDTGTTEFAALDDDQVANLLAAELDAFEPEGSPRHGRTI